MANATTNALMDIFRAKLGGADDDLLKLELFNVADEFAREVLRSSAPANVDAEPDTWLPAGDWPIAFQPLQHGVLGRMYAQTDKPWASAELAKFHLQQYQQYLLLARADASDNPATIVERIYSTVRVQVPMARDASIRLELYNVVDKIRKEALRLSLLSGADSDPTTWLPEANWNDAYQVIVHGILYRLYMQHGQQWSNPDLAKVQYGLYQQELERLRADQSTAERGGFIRLMDEIRPQLLGAPDNIIQIELFSTMREFLRESTVWRDYIDVDVVSGIVDYTLFPSETASITQLLYVVNENDVEVAATMEIPGELVLDHDPGAAAVYTAAVVLTVIDPVTSTGFPNFPAWLLELYADAIVSGVLGRMMSHNGKVWSSDQKSVYHLRRYRNGIAQARVAAERKNTRRQAWRFPQAFRTVRH